MIDFLRRRLLFRVILNGIILLLISAGGFLGLATILLGGQARQAERMMTGWFAAQACSAYAKTPTSAAFAAYPVALTVYSGTGEQLATSTTEAHDSPTHDELEQAASGKATPLAGSAQVLSSCAHGSGHYVSVGGPRQKPALGRLAVSVAAIVLLVAIGSIPLARSLVKPLRQLVVTAARFGEGDLAARAEVTRKDEIGDLAVAFNAMAGKLETRLHAEKEMLANISHELRTPLARARVVLEMATDEPMRAGSLLAEISKDFAELQRLIDDVLTTIKLDFADNDGGAPALRLRLNEVNLTELLRQAIAGVVELHSDRELVLESSDSLPRLRADPALLKRLFVNLLENAEKYSTGTILVRAHEEPEAFVVEVEDSGIGIDRADLDRIFEPFFRTDRSRQRLTGGTGLGLALCRRIVDLHGGTISATSDAGRTTVAVRLPRESAS